MPSMLNCALSSQCRGMNPRVNELMQFLRDLLRFAGPPPGPALGARSAAEGWRKEGWPRELTGREGRACAYKKKKKKIKSICS